ncbi:MAG: glycogen synthase GlgA [Candidatus Omnitrophica bacterium]|nr:glycogen synthase GlgA [Candidatus Omnitrophota bacterium]
MIKILIAASEIDPFAKTGGLADAMRSLPPALRRQGVEVALVMPKYRQIQAECEDLGEIQVPIEDTSMTGRLARTELPGDKVPVYLIDQEKLFHRNELYTEKGKDYPDNLERFTFFCRGVMEIIARNYFRPDVLHAHDWQAALLPIYIKTVYADHPVIGRIKSVFTIHNMAYQGVFPPFLYPVTGIGWEHFHVEALEFYNQLNLMKGAIVFADAVTTVSPTYAREIQTREYGCGLEGVLLKHQKKVTGVLNGVDYRVWSPEVDTEIAARYSMDTLEEGKKANQTALRKEFGLREPPVRAPLFGVISRLAHQKGLDLLAAVLPSLIRRGAQVVILGKGEPPLEETYRTLQKQFPESCGVTIAFDNRLAHQIEAGADIFLMPSLYEPCGMNQMYSLRYGTVPVVRATGGLVDTVTDVDEAGDGTGFVFEEPTPAALLEACERAIARFEDREAWLALARRGMRMDFSWDRSAQEYQRIYQSLMRMRG